MLDKNLIDGNSGILLCSDYGGGHKKPKIKAYCVNCPEESERKSKIPLFPCSWPI